MMLILTRKLGESILIGSDIRITILEIKGRQIRIGVDAPSSLVVHREEIYRLIQEQNVLAAKLAAANEGNLYDIWYRMKACREDEKKEGKGEKM